MELTIIDKTIIVPGELETIRITRDKFLEGKTIRVYDAAQKYGLPHQTLSNWAKRGMIRICGRQNHTLELDEADVHLAVKTYTMLLSRVSPQRAGRALRELLTT